MKPPTSRQRRRLRAATGPAAALGLLLSLLSPSAGASEPEVLRLPLPFPEFIAAAPEAAAPAEQLPSPAEVVAPAEAPPIYEAPSEPLAPAPVGPTVEFAFCEFCGESCSAGGCCERCRDDSRWGRFARGVYHGLCCPDPCYDPRWRPLADAAFFTAAVRPQNQQRFRWDFAEDMIRPDRAEYFWARADGSGRGPNPGAALAFGGLDYDELKHYSEVAHGSFGASIEYSYRSLDADGVHWAGFGDLTIGAKSLLFDTELVQVAFEMNTHVPVGSSLKGLGTGHVSLEPGMIVGLNLSQNSFLQVELSEWIPLGGDSQYAGAIFRYNAAYNRVLARPHPCIPVIGVVELNGWRFQDGAFTAVGGTPQATSGQTFVNVASGLRVFFCDKADFGVSYATAGTSASWTETLVRSEFRLRY